MSTVASSESIATVSAASSAAISRELLISMAQVASRQAVGRTTAAGSVPSTSLLLAQGVLKTMMLKKLIMIAAAVLVAGDDRRSAAECSSLGGLRLRIRRPPKPPQPVTPRRPRQRCTETP